MIRALLVAMLLVSACSSGGKTGPADGGAGGGGGGLSAGGGQGGSGAGGPGGSAGGASGTSGSGGAGGQGDQALCTEACATFASCGVTSSGDCSTECVSASTNYKSCLAAAGTDCNALALCYFRAVASTDCPAASGVPSGSATCAATDSCEGTCNTNGSGAACKCTCAAAASPTVAGLLLGINSCATNMCSTECSGTSGPDCNTCFQNDCATPRQDCLAH